MLTRFFSRPFTTRRTSRARHRPLCLEMLEAREVPTAGFAISQTTNLNTSDNGGSAVVNMRLLQLPTANVSISLTSDNTDEGIVSAPSLTFTPANWNRTQQIRVTGQHDGVPGGDQVYHVITGAATSDDPAYNGLDVPDLTLTNHVSHPKLLAGVVVRTTRGQSTGDGGAATFTLKLTVKPHADVTLSFASDNLAEGIPNVGSVTFTPDNWNQAQTVSVVGQADGIRGGSTKYDIVFGATASADARYNGLSVPNITLTNARSQKNFASMVVTPTSGLKTDKAGGIAVFTIVLTFKPSADVTIPISSSNTQQGVPNANSVTFTPDDWNQPKQVLVLGQDDGLFEGDIHYTIHVGPAQSDDPLYNGMKGHDVSVVNLHRTDVGRFDGTYVGTYTGTFSGSGISGPVTGNVNCTITDGVIVVQVTITVDGMDEGTGNGSGNVNSTGTVGFGLASGVVEGATFAGTFSTVNNTDLVNGNGTWRFSSGVDRASGFWNIHRV
jgi:hypothetical protein